LRRKFLAYFSSRFSVGFSVKQRYLQQQVSAQVVYDFFLQHNKLSSFVSGELVDLLLIGGDQSQAGQPNSLAEGPLM
jgi:hypothetical protein